MPTRAMARACRTVDIRPVVAVGIEAGLLVLVVTWPDTSIPHTHTHTHEARVLNIKRK